MPIKFLFKICICFVFLYIAYVDSKSKRISDRSVLLVTGLSLLSMIIFSEISETERVAGSVIISLPLLIIASLSPGSIGGGDIKLMAAAGLGLGVSRIWQAFVIAVFVSGIYVMGLLLLKKGDRKTEIALGPFLCLGLIIIWIWKM